jgi:hypothetical protein
MSVLLATDDDDVSYHKAFFPVLPLYVPAVPPRHSVHQFLTAALSVLCVLFPVQLSAVVSLSNVFPVQLTDITLSFSLQFQWFQF